MRFESLTGRAAASSTCSPTRPRADDGNDDHGGTRDGGLLAHDDTVASARGGPAGARARRPAATRGTASDPWSDLQADRDLDHAYDAREPGNVVQAARTRLTGLRRQPGA